MANLNTWIEGDYVLALYGDTDYEVAYHARNSIAEKGVCLAQVIRTIERGSDLFVEVRWVEGVDATLHATIPASRIFAKASLY